MAKQQPNTAVVILPSAAMPSDNVTLSAEEKSHSISITPLELPEGVDPSTVIPFYVLRKNRDPTLIVEIVKFTSSHGSWFFVPESELDVPYVCSNGNIAMVTTVDPLFYVLLLMDVHGAIGEKDLFQPLDSLCPTKYGVDITRICEVEAFVLLCDVKQAVGGTYYKLSEDKVVSWLIAKHTALVKHPTVKSKDAVEIISQYITPKWAKRLRKNILSDVENVDTAAHKAAKEAQGLAMAIMMEDAKESNEARRIEDEERFGTPFVAKKKKQVKPPKKKAEKAPEAKFWACREQSLGASSSKSGQKRTRSASASSTK